MSEQSYNSNSLSMCKWGTLQIRAVVKKIEPIQADATVYRRFSQITYWWLSVNSNVYQAQL